MVGSVTEGVTTVGSVTEGVMRTGSVTEGVTMVGSVTEGVTMMGSVTEGVTTLGSIPKRGMRVRFAANGATMIVDTVTEGEVTTVGCPRSLSMAKSSLGFSRC